jgi:hypothetical protein
MKFPAMILIGSLLLVGCGQSDQAKAAELVGQACAIGDTTVEKRESLIRDAVQLDEKYRPFLIAWLKWQFAADELGRVITGTQAHLVALKDLKENYLIQDSYCP